MRHVLLLCWVLTTFTCQTNSMDVEKADGVLSKITCTDDACSGTYQGPEFVLASDVAHQFSNEMARAVGDRLKALYRSGKYSRVDFPAIEMATPGMGSGEVTYSLTIPFATVPTKCDAYTSFDHVGGWGYTPALERRKKELAGVLLPGDELHISELQSTPEGLQEHWIQWRQKRVQQDCGGE